jgi:hypothetical protein
VAHTPERLVNAEQPPIGAKVVDGRIVVTDHRQCKGCDCPAVLELTREDAMGLRLQVTRAARTLGETRKAAWLKEVEAERAARDQRECTDPDTDRVGR